MVLQEEKMKWILNTNEASNKSGIAIKIVLENSSKVLVEEVMRLEKALTNNEVEYKAVVYGLELAVKLGTQYLEVNLDSKLVSSQLVGNFEAKEPRMKQYLKKALLIMSRFKSLKIRVVKR